MDNYSQKFWSPNGPFGRENSVFSGREVASLCRRGKARVVKVAEAAASLRTTRAKFVKMGMPAWAEDAILVFQSEFCSAMVRMAMDEMSTKIEDGGYDKMVDGERGGNGRQGIAVWTGSPVMKSKVPGAPTGNVRVMSLRFRKKGV